MHLFNFIKSVFARPKLTGLATTINYLQNQEMLLVHANTEGIGFISVAGQSRFIFGESSKVVLIPNNATDFIIHGFFYKKIYRISRRVTSFYSRRTKPDVMDIKRFSINTNTIKRIELNSHKLVISNNNVKAKEFNIKSICHI